MPGPLDALEIPGTLYLDVTAVSGSAPYGGTELGAVRDVEWTLTSVYLRHRAEEFGVAVVGDLFAGEAFAISFAIRAVDDTLLGAVWPNSRVGAVSQRRVVYGPGTVTPGTLSEAADAHTLLFVPTDEQSHPCVWLPRALPRRTKLDAVPMRRGSETVIGTTWLAIPGANGLAYEIGRLVDLTAP